MDISLRCKEQISSKKPTVESFLFAEANVHGLSKFGCFTENVILWATGSLQYILCKTINYLLNICGDINSWVPDSTVIKHFRAMLSIVKQK